MTAFTSLGGVTRLAVVADSVAEDDPSPGLNPSLARRGASQALGAPPPLLAETPSGT